MCEQELLALGSGQDAGREVVALVAGSAGEPGVSGLFAPQELQQLLEHERKATIHALT